MVSNQVRFLMQFQCHMAVIQKHTHMKISFHGTELKIEAVTIRNSENVDSLSLSPYALSEDGNQAQPCEIDNAEFWRMLKKDSLGRVSVVADLFVY